MEKFLLNILYQIREIKSCRNSRRLKTEWKPMDISGCSILNFLFFFYRYILSFSTAQLNVTFYFVIIITITVSSLNLKNILHFLLSKHLEQKTKRWRVRKVTHRRTHTHAHTQWVLLKASCTHHSRTACWPSGCLLRTCHSSAQSQQRGPGWAWWCLFHGWRRNTSW